MTTNHPAHGPVSLERLRQIREHLQHDTQYSKGGNRAYILADVLNVIDGAISAFGAEPVLYAAEETLAYAKMGELHLKCLSQPMGDAVIPLYAAPQLPQLPQPAVPDALDDYVNSDEHPLLWSHNKGWNAFRAAMLQGAEQETTAYKLPFDQWLSQQTGTIDVECGCVMTEVFFHWLRVAYDAGNSPVIADGWVILPAEPTQAMMNAWLSEVANWRGHAAGYRAMIAAAPQQEA